MDPFRERIENLLRQGKITPEEANRLLKALDSTGDTTSAPITNSQPVVPPPPVPPVVPPRAAPPPPAPVVPPVAPAPPAPPAPPAVTSTSTSQTTTIDGPIAKLIVSATAGDIDVKGVAGKTTISAHSSNGTFEVIKDGGSVRLIGHGRIDDPTEIGWLNTVLRTIGRSLPVNLEIEVPADLALLEIKTLAGNVDVNGLHGRVKLDLQAGDVTLNDASSFEITTKAGDVKVNTKLIDGESRISALAGDVGVKLSSGSSVTLQASTTAGDVSARGFVLTQTEKRLTGGSLEGRLGAGRGKLECRLTAGNLDILAIDGTNQ